MRIGREASVLLIHRRMACLPCRWRAELVGPPDVEPVCPQCGGELAHGQLAWEAVMGADVGAILNPNPK